MLYLPSAKGAGDIFSNLLVLELKSAFQYPGGLYPTSSVNTSTREPPLIHGFVISDVISIVPLPAAGTTRKPPYKL